MIYMYNLYIYIYPQELKVASVNYMLTDVYNASLIVRRCYEGYILGISDKLSFVSER